MRVLGAVAIAAVLAFGLGACKKSSPAAPTPVATLQSVAVSGSLSFANKNQTSQLTATATMSDGTTQNVTSTATWASSSGSVASVSSGGLLTALGNGTSYVSATYQGKTGAVVATVAMSATLDINSVFRRLCSPSRAEAQVILSETSGNIGISFTLVRVDFLDTSNYLKAYKSFAGTDLIALFGGNHLNPLTSMSYTFTTTYQGNIDVKNSSLRIWAYWVDDAGHSGMMEYKNSNQVNTCP
jgi:hypothetical protein